MDVFKLRVGQAGCFRLTATEYHLATAKKHPWYQSTQNGGIQHYGVCPECDNPIHIVNLDVDKKVDALGRALPLYAKHATTSINDLVPFNQSRYDDCSLANPESLNGKDKTRRPGPIADSIMRLLVEQADLIHRHAERFLGVQMPDEAFEKLLRQFKQQDGQFYRAVSPWNLPFALLYMGGHQNTYGFQVRSSSPFEEAMAKSKYFKLHSGRLIPAQAQKGVRLGFYITDHKIPADKSVVQTMCLVIEESGPPTASHGAGDSDRRILLKQKREMDLGFYRNDLGKRLRLRELAKNVLGK